MPSWKGKHRRVSLVSLPNISSSSSLGTTSLAPLRAASSCRLPVNTISNNNKLPPLNRPGSKTPDRHRRPCFPQREISPLCQAPAAKLTPRTATRSTPSTMAPWGASSSAASQRRIDSPQRHQIGTFNHHGSHRERYRLSAMSARPVSIARLGRPRPSPSTPIDTVNRGPPGENRVSWSSPVGLQSQLCRGGSSQGQGTGNQLSKLFPLRPARTCRQRSGDGTRGRGRGRGKGNQTTSPRQLTAPTARLETPVAAATADDARGSIRRVPVNSQPQPRL